MTTADATHEPVNTKDALRREDLRFRTLDELKQDLARIEQAESIGVLRATGNWTPGEVCDHLATFWKYSLDGVPPEMKPPLILKLAAKALFKKKAAAGEPPTAGLKFPKKIAPMLEPTAGVAFDEGLARLRACIERTEAGAPFTDKSPMFGEFTHQEWINLNLGHCALHLSFLRPE